MAKIFNNMTGRFEDDGQPDFNQMVNAPSNVDATGIDLGLVPDFSLRKSSPMSPAVKDYLLKKLATRAPASDADADDTEDSIQPPDATHPSILDQFSPEKYQQALAQMKDKQSNLGLSQFAAGIGDALARRDSSSTDKYYSDLKNNIQDQTVGEFNRQKANAVSDVKTKQQINQLDPNSTESQNFRKLVESTMPNIAKTYGDKWGMVTAADADKILDFGKMRETIDARKAQFQLARDSKASDKQNAAYNQTGALLEQMRGSPAVSQAEKDLYAVQKVNSLVNLYGDPNSLNPAQVQLLASEVAKIASGGSPSIHELQGLTPSTIPSNLATLAEKVRNKPTGARAGEFIKAMQDYTTSLAKDAQGVIKDRYGRIIETRKAQFSSDQYQTLQDQYMNRFKDVGRPQQSKIKVSNGKETLMIDAADLDHAQTDGYKQVQ